MKWIKKVAATPLTTIAKVVDSLQTQTNDRTNAPSIRAVNDAIANKWETIYPIGSIYMSVNSTNPSTVFGGTWQPIKDKFLLASGDLYTNGETGGTSSNTLDISQIPSHAHSYTRATGVGNHTLTTAEIPSHSHSEHAPMGMSGYNVTAGSTNLVDEMETIDTGNTGGGGAHNHPLNTDTANTSSVGSGAAIDNMPPYLAVNVWVRTA